MAKTLELHFMTAEGKKTVLSVDEPREDITPVEVTAAMQAIVDSGAFEVGGYPLESAAGARIVERNVTEIVN